MLGIAVLNRARTGYGSDRHFLMDKKIAMFESESDATAGLLGAELSQFDLLIIQFSPWLIGIFTLLSALLLIAGVLRLVVKTKLKGTRLMLVGTTLIALTVGYQHAIPSTDVIIDGSLQAMLLPKILLALGYLLTVAGFARLAWALSAAGQERP
jgi:hypothetical protein